ncbi:hypothetical protein WDW37_03800 [Bdellovibrionota bacterium FG-1]
MSKPIPSNSFTRSRAVFYCAGLFTSSFGSLTYAAALPALFFKLGVSPFYIGTLIGVMRLVNFMMNLSLGHIGDIISPKKVMIFCEIGAAVASSLIFWSWWKYGLSGLTPFFLANLLRVAFTSLQSGSIQKHGKLFDTSLGMQGRFAVILNGATHGTLFFGGILAAVFFDRLTIPLIVVLDAATFILNGLLLFAFQKDPEIAPTKIGKTPKRSFGTNLLLYYENFPVLMTADILLSLALCGSNTLSLRLLISKPEWIPLMPAIFGAAAFLTSFGWDRKFTSRSNILWTTYAFSLILQGVFSQFPEVVLGISFIRNCTYWLIFHAISRELMKSAPTASYSAITAGRTTVVIGVLASGEVWVGATQAIPIAIEMTWRSAVALFVPCQNLFRKPPNPMA